MAEIFKRIIDFDQAKASAIEKLIQAKEQSETGEVGFVSGIIMSDGPLRVIKNLGMLKRYQRFVKKQVDYPVLSAIDFLDADNIIRLTSNKQEHKRFWREILGSGYITDFFTTPRGQEKGGAKDEYETATKLGLIMHNVTRKNKK